MNIEPTNNSKKIAGYLLQIFDQYYDVQIVRNIGINTSKLTHQVNQQLNLFEPIQQLNQNESVDKAVD